MEVNIDPNHQFLRVPCCFFGDVFVVSGKEICWQIVQPWLVGQVSGGGPSLDKHVDYGPIGSLCRQNGGMCKTIHGKGVEFRVTFA